MAVFLVQRPSDTLVQVLDRSLGLLCYMAHNRVDHFALVVSLLALHNILRRNSALRQIDIACVRSAISFPFTSVRGKKAPHTLLLVHSENNDNLVTSNSDELLNTSDTSSGQLGQ